MFAELNAHNDSSVNVITCYVFLLHDKRPGFHSCLSQGLGGSFISVTPCLQETFLLAQKGIAEWKHEISSAYFCTMSLKPTCENFTLRSVV
jgi:hypothetical protein